MTTNAVGRNGEQAPSAAPSSIYAYIEDMLGELADLASSNGAPTLAASINLVALEAARANDRSAAA